MKPQSIANKKHREKTREAIRAQTPCENDLAFEAVNETCEYCNKPFTLNLKSKLEMSPQNWLAFYEKRPFLGIAYDGFSIGCHIAWHGLCFWSHYIKMGWHKN